jgi:hypothetical protein
MNFVFKSTAIVDSDPVGTFNTYTYAANTNTASISGTAPTQTVSSMNVNGIQVFARAYNAASNTASPARVDIKIGKGLKSRQIDAFRSLAKTNAISYDLTVINAAAALEGANVSYDELTGILSINAAYSSASSITSRVFVDQRNDLQSVSAYFVFNASQSPSLVSIPNLQMRVAYLSDVKTSGSDAGASSGGVWQTRTLNTLVDNTGLVTSLSANQFTISKGVYMIEASAPAYTANRHKIRLFNVTDNGRALVGTAAFTNSADGVTTRSYLAGEVSISTSKTFRIDHYIQTANASNGLGVNASNEDEIFTTVKITKIRD